MRLKEMFESINQKEADEVMRGLVASGDSVTANYFMQTRYDSRHTSIDSAQRAAERMAKRDLERKAGASKPVQTDKPAAIKTPAEKPVKKVDKEPKFSEPTAKDDGLDFDVFKKIKPFANFSKGFKVGAGLANKFMSK